MNRLEEIQEIIKNFIYEKQQMKQQITEIENKRNELAENRNKMKTINGNLRNVCAENAEAKIAELGTQIVQLGNHSQELQNKLDSKYIEVQKEVNIRIDNLIAEGIREIRKIEEQKEDIEESIANYEARNAKYEVQKQEFLTRFGRIPELSENAQRESKIQEQEYLKNKEIVEGLEEKVEPKENEITELAKYKRAFKNSNWNLIIPNSETEESTSEENEDSEIEALLTAVEEVISPLNVENTEENNSVLDTENNIEAIQEVQQVEEAITLPQIENIIEEQVQEINAIENNDAQEINEKVAVENIQVENVDKFEEVEVEYIEPIEEIDLDEINPIEEISLEEVAPLQEVELDKINPIQEVKIEEIETPEEIVLEDIKPIQEINIQEAEIEDIKLEEINIEDIQPIEENNNVQDNVQTIKEEQNVIQAVEEDIEKVNNSPIEEIKEQTIKIDTLENINKFEENSEEEIIAYEDSLAKTQELPTLGGKITITNIIAKFEERDLVYKAQLSNGTEINVYPKKSKKENLILKYKENIEEIKEILINYAVAEYRILDKKVIKKIDPIICDILTKFAKQYNYDAQNLIYNYAMSFSKYEECEIDAIPNITYNISYMEGTNLNKKEKEILSKICKNAKKNEKVDIVGCNTGFSKIRYILKRTFNSNNANALPEGKY